MVFKPPIQNQPGQTLNLPTAILISLEVTQRWRDSVPLDETQYLADQIIYRHYNDLAQFIAGSRQMRGDLMGQRTARDWGELRADFSYNQGQEVLHLIVRPEKTYTPTGGRELVVGGDFDVKWDFTAFPYPGMSQGDGTTVPQDMRTYGVSYVYDPGFSPSAPGPTSRTDPQTKVITSTSPVETPDIDFIPYSGVYTSPPTTKEQILVQGMQAWGPLSTLTPEFQAYSAAAYFTKSYSTSWTPPAEPASTFGYQSQDYSKKVAGSAILTAPLSGLEYWEVSIIKLPRGRVPDAYHDPLPQWTYIGIDNEQITQGIWNGNSLTDLTQDSGSHGTNWSWVPEVDTFLTPAIGICPGYFLPDDLLPGNAQASPGKFQDYGRILGMDQPLDIVDGKLYDRARSIYVVAGSVKTGTTTTSQYTPGYWYGLTVSSTGSVQTWTPDMASICQDNYATKPPPGSPNWPDVKVDFHDFGLVARGDTLYKYDGEGILSNIVSIAGNISGELKILLHAYNWVINDYITAYDAAQAGVTSALTPADLYGTTIGLQAQTGHARLSGPTGGMGQVYRANGATTIYVTLFSELQWQDTSGTYVTARAGYDDHALSWSSTNIFGSASGGVFGDGDGNTWMIMGKDGDQFNTTKMYDMDSLAGNPNYQLKYVAGSFSTPSTQSPVIYSDIIPTGLSADNFTLSAWQKLGAEGYHTPAFIGRIDQCKGIGSAIDDGTGATLNAGAWSWVDPVGAYTGVDIGKLSEGDVVMIAADADKGYVWFGRNGTWYLSDGTTVAHDAQNPTTGPGAATPTGWAAVMDGAKKSAYPITTPSGQWDRATAQPQYFPCVSYRLGPGELKFIFDKGKLKYSPPSGFMVYGQAKIG